MVKLARLTATSAASLPDGVCSDPAMKGLQLEVRGDTRSWIQRIQYAGKRTRLALDHLPSMNLANARDDTRKLHEMALQGIDPR